MAKAKKQTQPPIDNSLPLRRVIRETLQMAPARRWTVTALFAQIRIQFDFAAEADVKAALLWNQSKGYVNYEVNQEFERDEWFLTLRGRTA